MKTFNKQHLKKQKVVTNQINSDDEFIDVFSQANDSKFFEASFFDTEGDKIIIRDHQDLDYPKKQASAWTVIEVPPIHLINNLADSFDFLEMSTVNLETLQNNHFVPSNTVLKSTDKLEFEINNLETEQTLKAESISNIERPFPNETNFDVTLFNIPDHFSGHFRNQIPLNNNLELSKDQINEALNSDPTLLNISQSVDSLTSVFAAHFDQLKGNFKAALVEDHSNNKTCKVRSVHIAITCDHCKVSPIIGKRYKCLECQNFDLCENCEAKTVHAHPMLRLNKSTNIDQLQNSVQLNLLFWISRSFKSESEFKRRILKNLAGDEYEEKLYHSILLKTSKLQLAEFIIKMMDIFE